MNDLSKRIRDLRLRANKTPQDYAIAIGVTRQAILKWESGETENLKLKNLLRLAVFHKLTLDELVKGRDEAQKEGGENLSDEIWPFSVEYARFNNLSRRDKEKINEYIEMVICYAREKGE